MRLLVLVDGWEVECCLDPPRVGDRVRWPLRFVEADRHPLDVGQVQSLSASAVPLPDWEGCTLDLDPVRLDLAGAALYWEAPAPVLPGPLEVRGSVYLAMHAEAPDELPETAGTVVRLRMTATLYREQPAGSRSWEHVVPPDVVYRDVVESPKWFTQEVGSVSPVRLENALLVDLELGGGSVRSSRDR